MGEIPTSAIISALVSLLGILIKRMPKKNFLSYWEFKEACAMAALGWLLGFIVVLSSWSALRSSLGLPIVPEMIACRTTNEWLSYGVVFDYVILLANHCFYLWLRLDRKWASMADYCGWRAGWLMVLTGVNLSLSAISFGLYWEYGRS